MRASLSTMKWYGKTPQAIEKIGLDELVKLATNRLGGLEGYDEYGRRFDGVVVAKVMSCVDHADSDHLHVCLVDDGGVVEGVERDDKGYVQVVCGAPNVREGLIVAWIPPGAVVPSSHDKDELFTLGIREIRGVVSNGMLASPSELSLFENHDGILEISLEEVGDELTVPGTEFKKLYGLDDVLLDFENKMFTHRPDCFGQIGLARELAAIQGMKYTSPEWYWNVPTITTADTQMLEVFNDVDAVVPRLSAVAMGGVTVGESPVWLKSFLTRMGGKPINNVVDISNYIMHITGQPTHAYDLKKLAGATIGARMAVSGETIHLLNGKTIELSSDDIVIADNNGPIGLAGIMGGKDTEVDATTTDIVLEVGSFDMYTIRRSAMRHGLFTDAFTRFSKGQSPLQNDRVVAKFMEMLSEHTGATQSSAIQDVVSVQTQTMLDSQAVHEPVSLSVGFVNSRLGTDLGFDEISEILQRVEMAVKRGEGDEFEVVAPFFRTDIEIPEDVVEEVGRLHGFDQLELKLPLRSTKPAPKNVLNEYKSELRNKLTSLGANEVLSYSFVHGDTLKKLGIAEPEKWCYHLRNAISPDLQYYRPSLMPTLIPKVTPNLRSDLVRGEDNEFALYEIGKTHVKGHDDDDGLPGEMERLGFVFAADEKTASRKYYGSAVYMAKKYISALVGENVEYKVLETDEYPITSPYALGRSATIGINGKVIGVVGEFKNSVTKAFKLPQFCAGFELDITELMATEEGFSYEPIGTFPKVQQDITLSLPDTVPYASLKNCIVSVLGNEKDASGYQWKLLPSSIYKPEGSDKVNYTHRVYLWHPLKTLKIEETNVVMDTIATLSSNELGATRV